MSVLKKATAGNSEGSMDVEDSNAENDISDISNNPSDSEIEVPGNTAWADAMCRVLNTTISKEKNFILSKAKKDADVKQRDKDVKKEEIEIVDKSGKKLKTAKTEVEPKSKSSKERRKEMLEKQKQKSAWESMCRVKPDITHKDKERELIRIATRGVVSLFNTVEKHQKSKNNPRERNAKRLEKLGAVKGNFMDILKGHSKRELKSEADPVSKKANQEETWSILKDDFMMGAEMKDWDKNSDDDK